MLTIGRAKVGPGAWLAPLASVTSAPFRQVCLEQGCALAVTEMVSSEALVRNIRGGTLRMARAGGEQVLVVQMFGSDPITMARASAMAVEQFGADMIDVNMGCPVRKVLGTGAGVALMRDPDRAAAIVREIVGACHPVPVTVKMRAGWDDESVNALEIACLAEQNGAAAVTIHARTKQQVHGGKSRTEVIGAVKGAVSIPVIANGGIRTVADAQKAVAETGCDGVMIGRGALGNPWVFRSIAAGEDQPPTVAERFAMIRRHFDLYVQWAGERVAAREMRKHLCWYLRGMVGSAMVRAKLHAMQSSAEVIDTIDAYQQALERSGATGPVDSVAQFEGEDDDL